MLRNKLALLITGILLVAAFLFVLANRPNDSSSPTTSTVEEKAATATPFPTSTASTVDVASQPESPLLNAASQPASPLAQPDSPLALESVESLAQPIQVHTFEVIHTYPHDPAAFTQGLIYKDGILYEGTGLQGRSSLRKVDLESGTVLQQVDLSPEYFGEGITSIDNRIIQLTWQSRRGFIWSIGDTFTPVKDYTYSTEGWGITHDGTQLIMSDGTSNLYFWDPAIMNNDATEPTVIKTLPVSAAGEPVVRLNELEYINGEVYANIWQTDQIARIDPTTGSVIGWVDLAGLLTQQERANSDVLNGIAYDAEQERLFVTGKLWPKLFEIKLVPVDSSK